MPDENEDAMSSGDESGYIYLPLMKPIDALRNSKPYNCLEVYEMNRREEMQHMGDFKFLLDYERKLLKWHERAISRPEVARYKLPCFGIPVYLAKYYVVTKLLDRNYQLQEKQKSLKHQFMGLKVPPRSKEYHRKRNKEFRYEMHITNLRQKMAKKLKKVTSEEDVKSIEDNQFLMYHKAMEVWESLQEQAQKMRHVIVGERTDPKTMFPIQSLSEILVDTPPLPMVARHNDLVRDVHQFKRILRRQGKEEEIERIDSEMVVAPSERAGLFGLPPKWKPMKRIMSGEPLDF